jgi:hypothetical protein
LVQRTSNGPAVKELGAELEPQVIDAFIAVIAIVTAR